jgi:hypothetical protein
LTIKERYEKGFNPDEEYLGRDKEVKCLFSKALYFGWLRIIFFPILFYLDTQKEITII